MLVDTITTHVFDWRFVVQCFAFILTVISLRLAVFYYQRHKRYQIFKYYGIPGPKPNLLYGNLGDFRAKEFNAEVGLEYAERYGNVFGFFIGDEPTMVITNLDTLRKLFFNETESFRDRAHIFIDIPLTKGLLYARYNRWKVMRRIMSPAFNRYKIRGSSSTQFIEDSIKLTLDYIDLKQKGSSDRVAEINIHGLMKSTTLHLISAMSIKLPNVQIGETEPYVEGLDEFMNKHTEGIALWSVKLPLLKGLIGFLANRFEFDQFLGLVRRSLDVSIDEQLAKLKTSSYSDKEDEESKPMIDILIRMHHEGKMTRDEVIGNAETILLAGYDTTSTTLAYIFWVVAKYSEIQDRLREELMAHGIEAEYLQQVMFETMRLYPTVTLFTTRLATKTVHVDGITIPQGCRIIHMPLLFSRNPDLWPEPLKFDPERFKNGTGNHPCTFAPFGMNDKKCIGSQLAMMEMKMILCDTLLRHRVSLVSPDQLSLKTHSGFLTAPRDPITLRFEKHM